MFVHMFYKSFVCPPPPPTLDPHIPTRMLKFVLEVVGPILSDPVGSCPIRSVGLSVCLHVCLPVCLPVCLRIFLSARLCVFFSVCLPARLSFCLSGSCAVLWSALLYWSELSSAPLRSAMLCVDYSSTTSCSCFFFISAPLCSWVRSAPLCSAALCADPAPSALFWCGTGSVVSCAVWSLSWC